MQIAWHRELRNLVLDTVTHFSPYSGNWESGELRVRVDFNTLPCIKLNETMIPLSDSARNLALIMDIVVCEY